MRLDYSDKVGALREGPERRAVQKNRPRKAPVGIFAVLSVLVLLAGVFGAGILTGWYLFKGEDAPAVAEASPPVKQVEPVPAAAPPGQAAPQDTPLTFYKTLPSGGEGAIGSGLNLKLAEPAPRPKEAPAAASAAAKPAEAVPAATKPAAEKPAAEKPASGEARFVVQIASYRDKTEAEEARAKLNARGVAAYLVESKVKEKGVWYRLRAGRHLSRQEAEQLAAKAGSGAAVLPE